jgi:hypothetical protein
MLRNVDWQLVTDVSAVSIFPIYTLLIYCLPR